VSGIGRRRTLPIALPPSFVTEWNAVTEFFGSMILSQRVRELESSNEREADELAQLATLTARVEKRLQWLQKRVRTQRRKTVASEHGLALARCYLAAAQVREGVSAWIIKHRADDGAPASFAELERNAAKLVGALVAVVEDLLKSRTDGLHEPHASPHAGWGAEPADEEPDDDADGVVDET
jgi:hypothetical protein